ncbi:F-box family protein [Euphorbia peplus]|nr:F-box family protein [Euphorbia peplus]
MSTDKFTAPPPELPEGCIANILSFTNPKEACISAAVSSDFRDAANSDSVWESFLPPDYLSIVSASAFLCRNFTSKKQLYLSLCDDPVLIHDGKTSFWLDKRSGKKCYMISARGLSIIWSDTPQYWRWIKSDANSRFKENAELRSVCWLEIKGKINSRMLSTTTNYGVYLVYKLRERSYGFEYQAVEATAGLVEDGGNENRLRSLYLGVGIGEREDQEVVIIERRDGWLEIELGEFFNKEGEDGDMEMSVKEVKHLNWKRGLLVQGIEIRPKFTV